MTAAPQHVTPLLLSDNPSAREEDIRRTIAVWRRRGMSAYDVALMLLEYGADWGTVAAMMRRL